jgi:hypothetical protein
MLLAGCSWLTPGADKPSATPAALTPRYASPEEIAPVATIAAQNCGKPYFGTWCP